MRRYLTVVLLELVAVLALTAVGVTSASALPEVVLKTGKTFPVRFKGTTGPARLTTATSEPVECKKTLLLGEWLSAMLGDIHFVSHECGTKILGMPVNCQTNGAPAGLILTPVYLSHIGKAVTLANGERHVLAQTLVTETVFECGGATIKARGNLIGLVPEKNAKNENQFNNFRASLEVRFEASSAGKQRHTTYESTLPVQTFTNLHLELSTGGGAFEEAAEEASGEAVLEPAGETAELKV